MKKEFRIPEIEIVSFILEDIVLASGSVPELTNVDKAKGLLSDENINIDLQTIISL